MWTFKTLGAIFCNYTHPATRAPEGGDPFKDQRPITTMISNLFPYILFQSTSDETEKIQTKLLKYIPNAQIRYLDAN
jgi:hypothetical protein